jgi:hypothetical protein
VVVCTLSLLSGLGGGLATPVLGPVLWLGSGLATVVLGPILRLGGGLATVVLGSVLRLGGGLATQELVFDGGGCGCGGAHSSEEEEGGKDELGDSHGMVALAARSIAL